MAEKKIRTNLISYIALGVSVVAIAIAIFGGHCPRHPKMMDRQHGEQFRGEQGQRPNMRQDEQGMRQDGQRPEAQKANSQGE